MDRIEDALRETLDRHAATPPPLPELMEAVEQRRSRQRRRSRVLATAVAAVLFIAAGSATAALIHTGHRHPAAGHAATRPSRTAQQQGGIPFAPIPAGTTTVNTDLPMTGSTTPTCAAHDLRVRVIKQRVVAAVTYMQLVAESISGRACRIDRNTLGLGITTGRADDLLDVGEGSNQVGYPINREPRIDPAASVLIDGSWQNWCANHGIAAYPVLRPSRTITIPASNTVTPPECDTTHYQKDSTAFVNIDAVAPPGSVLATAPAIHAPSTVRAGTTLHYQLTVTNPTDTPISLKNCPAYTEELGNLDTGRDPGRTTASYQLNCAAAQAIPAQASITFQMQLPVPAHDAGHTLELAWHWRGGTHATPSISAFQTTTIHVNTR